MRSHPLAARRFEIGLIAVVVVVLLRITLGWHFMYQGIWKWNTPEFSSAGFLKQAKGPFADRFRGMIPDLDGQVRLDKSAMAAKWKSELEAFKSAFGLTAERVTLADAVLARQQSQLDEYLEENDQEIASYWHEHSRLNEQESDRAGQAIPYKRQRAWEKRKELEQKAGPWLAEVDRIDAAFHSRLVGLLSAEEKAKAAVPWPQSPTESIDRLVMWSNLIIGTCLLLGFLSRPAAFAGGCFLATIVLAQPEWPTVYPPAPAAAGRSLIVNKEFVEMMALFALAALPSGRWAGLDYFFGRLFGKQAPALAANDGDKSS